MGDVMSLRKWQAEAVDEAEKALARGEHGVIQAIMGAGKSIALSELAARAFRAGVHVVITVPSQELVRQLARTVSRWTGQVVGEWYADSKDLWPITVVCQMSLETYEQAWIEKYSGDAYVDKGNGWKEREATQPRRLWIADECHKTECDTVLAWNAPQKRIGFTATPWRSQMSESISSFDSIVYEYGADQAFKDGHIVKPKLHHPRAGDIDEVVAEWCRKATAKWGGGVVNARSIADAEEFAPSVAGVVVHSQNENDAERAREVIRAGGVVVYVNMLAEGFDCPEIRWMAMRRAVGSRVRFAQEVGRGLRACEGKDVCHMLDVWDLWGTHSMDWRAALGEVDNVPVPALQLDWMVDKTGSTPNSIVSEQMPPELLSPLRSWLRHERVQALFEGRINSKEIKSRSWRSDPCSRKQLEYLDECMRRLNPDDLDEALVQRVRIARAALIDCLNRDPNALDGAFRKGDASDLIDVVRGLS